MADGSKSILGAGHRSSKKKLEPYPVDTTETLSRLISNYERTHRAKSVSFRRLVPWLKIGERATHYLHPYPAKLLPQIAHFFLASTKLIPARGLVLDPFGGTGTVALETLLSGRKALYADVNPLARLIAEVKTSRLDPESIENATTNLVSRYFSSTELIHHPDVVNIKHWYHESTIVALTRLKCAIDREADSAIRSFMQVTFSVVARKVSCADPRLSVPVRQKAEVPPQDVESLWRVFNDQLRANLKRLSQFNEMRPLKERMAVNCVGDDARHLIDMAANRRLRAKSVDAIITSPPYAGAQKYIRASSLNLGWLGLADRDDLAPLERRTIGREHYSKSLVSDCPLTGIPKADRLIAEIKKINPLRALIAASYLLEMKAALAEMYRVLKPGAHLVLVIGNNEVCGKVFRSSEYMVDLCEKLGFITRARLVDEIKSRGLMTKRNRSAGIISREWVLVFQK